VFGTYGLIDPSTNFWVASGRDGFGFGLNDIEEWLGSSGLSEDLDVRT